MINFKELISAKKGQTIAREHAVQLLILAPSFIEHCNIILKCYIVLQAMP